MMSSGGVSPRMISIGARSGTAAAVSRIGSARLRRWKTSSTLSEGSSVRSTSTSVRLSRRYGTAVISLRIASQHSGSPAAWMRKVKARASPS
jgi:hypothetical protein